MPKRTSLETALAFSLALAPALTACSFGGGDGDDGEEDCTFSIRELCEVKTTGKLSFSDAKTTFNTNGTSCTAVIPANAQTGIPELCVVAAEDITVESNSVLRATGTRPLVLLAKNNLQIVGTLDASSTRADGTTPESLGAGANPAACGPFAQAPISGVGGGGGGAGGSFVTQGGIGGTADTSQGGKAGGIPNTKLEKTSPAFLRGGCRGQSGGTGVGDSAGGLGGPGGGAVYLLAKTAVRVTGTISANGGGGAGGKMQSGGGGGGAGGLIFLAAPEVVHRGLLTANGGGGGEGGYLVTNDGAPGADGAPTLTSAAGGNSSLAAGHGGAGGATNYTAPTEAGGSSSHGGGGGGGGVGWVRAVSDKVVSTNGTASPPRD